MSHHPKRRRSTPIRHEGSESFPYLGSEKPESTRRPGAPPPKKGAAMLKDDIAYLLKFASKEAYFDDLINGRLYTNAAGY